MEQRASATPKALYAGATLFLGLMMAVAAFEALLRLVAIPAIELHRRGPVTQEDHRRFFAYDAELGWRGRAGASGLFSGWEFAIPVHLNELGFRDAHPWTKKDVGQYELLVFGDSITWGFGVEEGRRYSDLLASELSRQGIKAIVRNVAVNGYDTGQELLLYRQLRGISCADLVLVGLYSNDLHENVSAWQGAYPKPYFQLAQGTLELANVPVPSAQKRSDDRQEGNKSGASWWREAFRVYALAAWMKETIRQAIDPEPAALMSHDARRIEVTAALLRQLAAEVRQDNGEVAVVVLPDARSVTGPEEPELVVAATRSGVSPLLNLMGPFRQAEQSNRGALFYRLDGAHWTSRAHELAAIHLAQALRQTVVFRKPPRQCSNRA